jgi:DNA gyrase subunit A
VIELKKDAYPKKILNQLYNVTELQTTFHYNMPTLYLFLFVLLPEQF